MDWMAIAVALHSILIQWHTSAHVAGDSSRLWKTKQPAIREEICLALSIFSLHWSLGRGISQESNHINVNNYIRWSHSFENCKEIDHIFPTFVTSNSGLHWWFYLKHQLWDILASRRTVKDSQVTTKPIVGLCQGPSKGVVAHFQIQSINALASS